MGSNKRTCDDQSNPDLEITKHEDAEMKTIRCIYPLETELDNGSTSFAQSYNTDF